MADSFGQLGERADAVSKLCASSSASLAASFEAPLKEFVRTAKAVKKVCADRSAALQAYQQARGDVDARRTRLAKLRGTPGVREERVAEAERDLSDAQQRAEGAKAAYEASRGLQQGAGAGARVPWAAADAPASVPPRTRYCLLPRRPLCSA